MKIANKGKYLTFKIKTTKECIDSLGPIDKKVFNYLVKIGDVIIINKFEKESE
ncbi:MAG: hypothetical protein PHV39_05345 [Methanomicrobium sp.]|jgi:hypothetical protein|nr:hypothetical protein [Methanomicrobium sp.]